MHDRLIRNAFWKFRLFCVYSQTVPDSLHLSDIGLFQTMLVSCLATCKETVFENLPEQDRQKLWTQAMDRLQWRLRSWAHVEGVRISNAAASIGHRIADAEDDSMPLLKASDFRTLMLVSSYWYSFDWPVHQSDICFHPQALPLAMANLFEQELNAARKLTGEEIEDPTHSVCLVLLLYVRWVGPVPPMYNN
jgi:hypothetical protein